MLSARGTVLLGEPEIVAVEPIGAGRERESGGDAGDDEVARILSLAAGRGDGVDAPVRRGDPARRAHAPARADDVRNATVHAGLGVTALASTGERLVVGGRAIMLAEKIGVAAVDGRVTELEGQGRSVLLVALGDRLVGLISLQDGLRAGARAAVQRLLDARIEPVLLSGEARDTCETIGRALDIEHVRPAVLPADRGPEVRALGEGGSVVAVIGHPVGDDGALGAADVAVAMGAAGSTPGEWAVALASDDVRDAAMALAIPHATRARVRVCDRARAPPRASWRSSRSASVWRPLAIAPLAALARRRRRHGPRARIGVRDAARRTDRRSGVKPASSIARTTSSGVAAAFERHARASDRDAVDPHARHARQHLRHARDAPARRTCRRLDRETSHHRFPCCRRRCRAGRCPVRRGRRSAAPSGARGPCGRRR